MSREIMSMGLKIIACDDDFTDAEKRRFAEGLRDIIEQDNIRSALFVIVFSDFNDDLVSHFNKVLSRTMETRGIMMIYMSHAVSGENWQTLLRREVSTAIKGLVLGLGGEKAHNPRIHVTQNDNLIPISKASVLR